MPLCWFHVVKFKKKTLGTCSENSTSAKGPLIEHLLVFSPFSFPLYLLLEAEEEKEEEEDEKEEDEEEDKEEEEEKEEKDEENSIAFT